MDRKESLRLVPLNFFIEAAVVWAVMTLFISLAGRPRAALKALFLAGLPILILRIVLHYLEPTGASKISPEVEQAAQSRFDPNTKSDATMQTEAIRAKPGETTERPPA